MKRLFAVAMLTVLLSGCLSTSPKSFTLPTEPSYFELHQTIPVDYRKPVIYRYGINKGIYVAKYEDSDYVYFQGEGACVLIPTAQPGGVRLPKPGAKGEPGVWIEITAPPSTAQQGLVVYLGSLLEAGRIRILPPGPNDETAFSKIKIIHAIYVKNK